ncbi:nectin-3-like protein isoform X1 [Gymnodraco acuticeps]|uniref:Nectin cell adhesion molecule 3 n=1 Tax=Gymnodraco acuticeps TaxID=8218 RepID=A0A6P8T8V3_GYMAC|nr:nectin-3-like protein isoform X1 [Gymnodraco acuticeps]
MLPSYYRSFLGQRGRVALFYLLCSITGVWGSQVMVPKRVNAVLGKNVTLECKVEAGTNLTLTQSSWERHLPSGSITVAVYNPQYGISIPPEYIHRLYFRSPSSHDATIVVGNVGFSDVGKYTCKVATFPLGYTQASTTVNVLVEPKVYVSAGSTALIDGGNDTLVATCIAERARPPAEVSWESNLFGQSEVQLFDETNGTTSTQVSYLWQPTRHIQGQTLTCVVRHPALESDFRIPYQLNVQYAPDISVVGYDGDWYVGRENAQMTCKANANPPANQFRWIRLDSEMPAGMEIMNSTLLFLRPLQRNDSGVYRCEVANDINLRSRDVRLLIQDPPTMPSTITAPVLTGSASSTLVDDQGHVLLSSPTLEALPESNLGSIVGGAVGGALFLLLLLCLVGVCYLQKQQTFHGNYYTKQYLGPNDLQKAPTQHELHPPKAGSSSHRQDHDREEWGDRQLKQERDHRHQGNREEYPSNGYTRAMRESGHQDQQQNQHREPTQFSSPQQARGARHPRSPKPLGNGSPYLSDDCYDSGPEGDYVSHTDGSVISRREWYV